MPNEPEPSPDGSMPKRLNLDLNAPFYDCLLDVKKKSGAASMTEAIRRALRLYQVILNAERAGEELFLRNGKGDTKVIIV
jgi:hypothetical protein